MLRLLLDLLLETLLMVKSLELSVENLLLKSYFLLGMNQEFQAYLRLIPGCVLLRKSLKGFASLIKKVGEDKSTCL